MRRTIELIGLISLGFDFLIGAVQLLLLGNLKDWSFTFTINAASIQNLANQGITFTDIGAGIAFIILLIIYLTEPKHKLRQASTPKQ